MIPKKIHYCWFGGTKLPPLAIKCIDSWKKHLPDYEIIEWNETNFDISQCKYMQQAYDNKKWGFVPDYARFKIVYENGGIYLDTDVEILKNLDSFLTEEGILGFESTTLVNGGNIIAGEAGNPILREMYEIYESESFVNNDGTLNLVASPKYNTEVLVRNGLIANNTLQRLRNITVYPTEYFCPKDFETGIINITDNTYSIHHFDGSWISDSHKKYLQSKYKLYKKYPKKFADFLIWFPYGLYLIREKGLNYFIKRALKKIGIGTK
jgi:mannosyltransferase OCH1-like enzyme